MEVLLAILIKDAVLEISSLKFEPIFCKDEKTSIK